MAMIDEENLVGKGKGIIGIEVGGIKKL